jgi:hypothetical protein
LFNKKEKHLNTIERAVSMSRAVLMGILSEMRVSLSEIQTEQLYRELLAYFGLIGATNECQALENAWKDPYNKREIEEFIKAWLRRKQRKKEEIITGVV